MAANARRNTMVGPATVPTASTMDSLYEALDIFARGSFGVVRKVLRRSDGLLLCRKELNYGRMNDQDLLQLNTEVHVLQTMPQCDHIVRYYERFVDKRESMLHIVMEYCEGGDLAGVIQRCRRDKMLLSEATVWNYMTQITLALAECHSETDNNGNRKTVVLHRDIKPENVFLGRGEILKLGDFGLSKAMAAAAFTSTYVGTPYYMSPELTNQQQYDAKSDIWALGCLIYELCAQQPPFAEAQTQPELTKLIREGRIPKLPSIYSPTLNQVIRSMLRQDPKMRPTAQQIKSLDQVRHCIDRLGVGKIRDTLASEREVVEAREAAVAVREEAVAERERQVADREASLNDRERSIKAERDQLRDERNRLLAVLQPSVEYDDEQSDCELDSPSCVRTSDDRENVAPGPIRPSLDIGGIAKVASRPSLVPRRPLEERRSMIALSAIARRQSTTSLMSLDETPVKAAKTAYLPTPGTEYRRRIAQSKSMHNLHMSPSSDSAPLPPLPLHLTSSNASRRSSQLPSSSSDASSRRSPESMTSPELPSVHEQLAPSMRPISPSKRPAPSSSGSSGHSQPAPSSNSSRPSMPTRTATAPATNGLPSHPSGPVRYDLLDDDDVPSPFIKKKASAPPSSVMRRLVGSAVGPLRAAPARPPSVQAQLAAAAANGGGPATGTRHSLASKLATNRAGSALGRVDETGRIARRGSTLVSATLS